MGTSSHGCSGSLFFIVGVARSGTTSVYRYLQKHEEVVLTSEKETNFFAGSEYKKGRSHYFSKYFDSVNLQGGMALGEVCPTYFYWSHIPRRINEMFPEAKIIVILRNRVERAYSHWRYRYFGRDETLKFESALLSNLARMERGQYVHRIGSEKLSMKMFERYKQSISNPDKEIIRNYIDIGYYGEIIDNYLEYFDESQVKVMKYNDLRSNPRKFINKISKYLEIGAPPDKCNIGKVYNTSGSPWVRYLKSYFPSDMMPQRATEFLKDIFLRSNNRPGKDVPQSASDFLHSHYWKNRNERCGVGKTSI